MPEHPCLFCDRSDEKKHRIIVENEPAYACWDNFPVSPGHLEVVPKRHVESFFELEEQELLHLYTLLLHVEQLVDAEFGPNGYNIGINEGVAAGRTVHHLHIHLIPRYNGDVTNPRGGVRNIIPGKGDYLKK